MLVTISAENALAQTTDTWTGGTAPGDWSNGSNWGSGSPLSPIGTNPGYNLLFAGTNTVNTNDIGGVLVVNGIAFSANAGPFTLSGNPVAIGDFSAGAPGITNNATGTETISNSTLYILSDQTWDAASGSLVITSTVTPTTGVYNSTSLATISITGAGGSVTVSGPIEDDTTDGIALGVTVDSGGTAILTGSNTYTGTTSVASGGLLVLTGTQTNNPISVSGTFTESSSGAITGTSTLAILTGGTGTLGGSNTYTGTTSVASGGSLVLTGTQTNNPISDSGTFTEASSGAITGTSTLAILTGGTGTLGGSNTYTGTTSVASGGLLVLTGTLTNNPISDSGTFTESSSGAITGTSSLTILTGGTGTLSGTNSYSGATVVEQSGTLMLANGGSLSGTAITSSATFGEDVSSSITGTSSLLVSAGTTTLSGTNKYTGTTTVNGGELVLNGTLGSGVGGGTAITNSATLLENSGGVITGTSSLVVSAGTTTLSGTNSYTGTTTVNGGELVLNGTLGSGVGGGTAITSSATLLENSGGVITGTSSLVVNAGTTTLSGTNSYTGSTTVNGGELDLSGTLGSGGGTAITSSATFNETSTGSITGASSLTVSGGTTTLSGSNNFSGATAVRLGGTLTIRSDTGLNANSATTVNNGGTLQLENNITTTAASLTLNGAGTNTVTPNGALENVSGTNTYTGVITLGSNATIGSDAGSLTLNNVTGSGGTLTLTGAGTGSISGAVATGAGGLTMNGTGTWSLAGVNTYTGKTSINNGELYLTGTLGSGGGTAITSSATFIESAAGSITGTSSLAVIGGTTTLNAANSYNGGTSVSGGLLKTAITGALGATTSSLTVSGGSVDLDGTSQTVALTTMSGNGMITTSNGAATLNSGVSISGGSPTIGSNVTVTGGLLSSGTLTNNGTIIQSQNVNNATVMGSGVFQLGGATNTFTAISIVPTSSAVSPVVPIAQVETSSPYLINTTINGSSGSSPYKLTIDPQQLNSLNYNDALAIAVTSTLTNTDLVFNQAAAGFTLVPTYSSGTLSLEKILSSQDVALYETGASGPYVQSFFGAYLKNQPQVLAALRKYGSALFTSTSLTNPGQVTSALATSFPSVHIGNVELRLTDAREGKSGFSASNVGEGLAGPEGPDGKEADFMEPSEDNRWGVFLTGIGDFAHTGSLDGYVGYNTTQSGFTLGADYRVTPYLILGALAGFGHEHAGFADGSSLTEDGGKLGFYGTAFTGGYYLNFAGIGGYDTFDSHRIDIGGTTAKGSGDAEEVAGFVGTGYDFTFGNLKIGPTASFQYQRSFTQKWDETDGTVPLDYPAQSTGEITTKAGAKASFTFRTLGYQLTPELRTEWQHDFRGSIPVDFDVPGGPVVQDNSPHVGLDSLSIVAGSSAQLSETYTVYLYYNGDLLRENYLENDVSGGVRCSF